MPLSLKQLDTQLVKTRSPFYLISGDEPLLTQDAREKIITAARSAGFESKVTYYLDSGFQIETLIASIQNRGLFDDKKIIDLRHISGKLDADLTDVLSLALKNPQDQVIILSTSKLTPAQQKSDWCQLFEKQGCWIAIWPMGSRELPAWLLDRAKKANLNVAADDIHFIAHYCEGNLLAANQVLEKLQLLFSGESVSREQIKSVLFDHARFNPFDLSDAISQNNTSKFIRILNRLQQTGEEPVLVLWHISRAIREKINSQKNNMEFKKALQRAAQADAIIKGAKTGDAWQAIMQIGIDIGY